VEGNGLGIWLCVRNLIEHRAMALSLPEKIKSTLDLLADDLRAAEPLPQNASYVEQLLMNALIHQSRNTAEARRAWTLREGRSDGMTTWLNLDNMIAAFSEEDRIRTLYALGSAAMHGRTYRGQDVMRDGPGLCESACGVGLLVLELLCDFEKEMTHLSVAMVQSMRLSHAANVEGTMAATSNTMACQSLGIVHDILTGLDYAGDGSEENPIRYASHLEFFAATHALLRQLGVDPEAAVRVLDGVSAGYLRDRWSSGGRNFWFERPISG